MKENWKILPCLSRTGVNENFEELIINPQNVYFSTSDENNSIYEKGLYSLININKKLLFYLIFNKI